jgi:hypothetical protein
MVIIKKLVKYLLLVAIALIFVSPLWIRIIPNKYFTPFASKVPIVDKLLCNFSVKVSGDSMNPIIKPGTSVNLSRCFEEKDLTVGTVVLFQDNSALRFSIIRYILPLEQIVYKISNEKTPELFQDVIKEEIVGINHELDVSKTKYQAKQNLESFILNPSEFISDFYLGKIPKGMGIENTSVSRTTSFSRANDKFCDVIVPKKRLTNVDTEIINTQTQEKIPLGNNIIFDLIPSPNINCADFGSQQGMLNLNPGNYRYRFLLNHQVLEEIPFTVK